MSVTRDFHPRSAMPLCTAFVDDVRQHFGAPVRIHAVEAGREIVWGQAPARGVWRVAFPVGWLGSMKRGHG